MSARKTSLQTPELPGMPRFGKSRHSTPKSKDVVISRDRAYKGGRVLPCAARFRTWREVQGHSLAQIAAKLEGKTREFGIDGRYLLTRLYEFEQGRFKPPTWLVLLLIDAYGITFPWWAFHE